MLRGTGVTSSVIQAAGSPCSGRERPSEGAGRAGEDEPADARGDRLLEQVQRAGDVRVDELRATVGSDVGLVERRRSGRRRRRRRRARRTQSRSAIDPTTVGGRRLAGCRARRPRGRRSGSTRVSASPRCPELPVTRILTLREISEPPDRPPTPCVLSPRPSSTSTSRAPPRPSSCGGSRRATGSRFPERLLGDDGRFRYTDFLDFLRTYDLAASVIRTGEDYRDITYEYLCSCARGGAIYVELTASPDHAALVGLSDEEHLGRHRPRDRRRPPRHRHRGPDPDLGGAQLRGRAGAARRPLRRRASPSVRRRLLDGRRRGRIPGRTISPRCFRSPPAPASAARSTPASGPGPDSVRAALELPVTRISHGVRAIEDPVAGVRAGRARDRARVLPDQQRRARRVPSLRGASAAASCATPASGSRSAPTIRRTSAPRSRASTRCAPSGWASARTICARSPPPRSTPRSATRICGPRCAAESDRPFVRLQ